MSVLETTHIHNFRNALYDLLVNDPGLAEVEIHRFPVDPLKTTARRWIEMWGISMDAEWDLLGIQSQSEVFTLEGRIVALMGGHGPEQEEALINETEAICARLENIIRDNYKGQTVTGSIRDLILTEIETIPLYTDAGIVMLVPFSIRVNSQLRYV